MFITKEKQSHLTQYQDSLDGTNLSIEGEKNHLADRRIINGPAAGDEIHLFYRNRHHENFTYYGRVSLVRYEENTNKPSRFWFSLAAATDNEEGTEQNSLIRDEVVCRICWNSQGWTHPTGEAASLEKGSFVTKYGFGHEEWLMNIGWVINGWHYGFLQPINSAFAKYQGRELDVLLYAIAPAKIRFYIGRINRLNVLTRSQAELAVKEYRQRGWLREMAQQVNSVSGKSRGLEAAEAHNLLNVRYRPESLELFVPPEPADNYLSQLPGQYHVYPFKPSVRGAGRKRTRRATAAFNKTALLPHQRKGSGTVIFANPIEKIMQQEICEHLRKQYTNVEAERDFVDIKIEGPKGITLIELKSSASALLAIRAALGQILEYAFVHPEWHTPLLELVIVGQGLETEQSKRYLEWLRHDYNLPVRYISYQRGAKAFRL